MNDMELAEEIIDRFKIAQLEKATAGIRSPTIHVSTLVHPCVRKSWYDMHRADHSDELPDYDSVCNFYLGNILHENSHLGGKNELGLAADLLNLKAIREKAITQKNLWHCVTGHIDDLIDIRGEKVIVDKKTFGGRKPSKPDPSYVEQLNIYKLLYWIQSGNEVNRGCILYLSKANSFKDPIPFMVQLDPLQVVYERVLEKLSAIQETEIPDREVTFKCNWCPHLAECKPFG